MVGKTGGWEMKRDLAVPCLQEKNLGPTGSKKTLFLSFFNPSLPSGLTLNLQDLAKTSLLFFKSYYSSTIL